MSLLDYFKSKKTDNKIRKSTMVYGVYKEVLWEGDISPMDYLMLNPFNRKQYVFPCLFLAEDDAMTLRNAYTRIKAEGERYIVFEETYNNIFGNGQSPFKKAGSQKLYHSYDEFVAERKSEYKNNQSNNNVSGNTRLSKGLYRTVGEQEKYIEDSLDRELP